MSEEAEKEERVRVCGGGGRVGRDFRQAGQGRSKQKRDISVKTFK